MPISLRFLILISISLFTHTAIGQRSYLKGYLLQHNGDTTWGLLSDAETNKTPDKVWFKPNDTAKAVLYLPSGIRGYGINTQRFLSAYVKMISTPFYEKRLSDEKELSLYSDSTFIEQLVAGEKSLYKKYNADGKLHFYVGLDSGFQLLDYKRYVIKTTKGDILSENRKFLAQLNFYLQSCPGIYDYLLNIQYTQEDLLKLFKHYASCTKSNTQVIKGETKSLWNYSIMAGVNKTNLLMDAQRGYEYLDEANLSSSYNLCFGTNIQYFLSGYASRWFIGAEAFYLNYQVEGNYTSSNGQYQSKNYLPVYGSEQIQLNAIIGRQVKMKFGNYFYKGGISGAYRLSETNAMKIYERYYSQNLTYTNPTFLSTRLFEGGLLLGTGISVKKLSLELRLQRNNGPSNTYTVGSPRLNTMLILGYTF